MAARRVPRRRAGARLRRRHGPRPAGAAARHDRARGRPGRRGPDCGRRRARLRLGSHHALAAVDPPRLPRGVAAPGAALPHLPPAQSDARPDRRPPPAGPSLRRRRLGAVGVPRPAAQLGPRPRRHDRSRPRQQRDLPVPHARRRRRRHRGVHHGGGQAVARSHAARGGLRRGRRLAAQGTHPAVGSARRQLHRREPAPVRDCVGVDRRRQGGEEHRRGGSRHRRLRRPRARRVVGLFRPDEVVRRGEVQARRRQRRGRVGAPARGGRVAQALRRRAPAPRADLHAADAARDAPAGGGTDVPRDAARPIRTSPGSSTSARRTPNRRRPATRAACP